MDAKNITKVIIGLLFFTAFYYYIFYTNQTYSLRGDNATSLCLEQAIENNVWCSYVMCGIPTTGSLVFSRQYNPILLIQNLIIPYNLDRYAWIFTFFLIAGLGVYALLIRLKIAWWIGVLCGFFYAFNLSMIVYADVGHGSKLMTISFLPWMLFFADYLFEKKSIVSVLFLAGCFYLQLVSLHVQIAYYGVMMVGFYAVYHFAKDKRWKPLLMLVVALVMGLLAASPLYGEIYEYSKISVRSAGVGWDYATQWSFHPFESITYILPGYFGFGGESYHGYMPFTDAPLYWGIAVLVFSFIAAVWGKSRLKWFLVTLALLAWVISFGKHFPILYAPLYFALPFFNKFRAPMMIQVLVLLPMVVLAGIGMARCLKFKRGWMAVAVISVVGMCQLAVLGKAVVHPVSVQTIKEYLEPDSVVEFLQKDDGIFRILPLVSHHDPNWYAAHHIESVLGAIGVKMANYKAAMGSLFPSGEFLDLANVKYIITEKPQQHSLLHEVFVGDGQYVYLYEKHRPRAYFSEGGGTVQWIEKSQDRIVLNVEVRYRSLLFFSGTFHSSWRALIDGISHEIIPVNVMFRGVYIPPGSHRVVMEFK